MCQSRLEIDGEVVVENVTWMEPIHDGVLVCTLFDDPREVQGTLTGVDFLKHRIVLKPTDTTRKGR